jgi:hypothetical protein
VVRLTVFRATLSFLVALATSGVTAKPALLVFSVPVFEALRRAAKVGAPAVFWPWKVFGFAVGAGRALVARVVVAMVPGFVVHCGALLSWGGF